MGGVGVGSAAQNGRRRRIRDHRGCRGTTVASLRLPGTANMPNVRRRLLSFGWTGYVIVLAEARQFPQIPHVRNRLRAEYHVAARIPSLRCRAILKDRETAAAPGRTGVRLRRASAKARSRTITAHTMEVPAVFGAGTTNNGGIMKELPKRQQNTHAAIEQLGTSAKNCRFIVDAQ